MILIFCKVQGKQSRHLVICVRGGIGLLYNNTILDEINS